MSGSVTEEARRQANLRLLQRTASPDITDIGVSATHVVLYEYRDTAWHKSGIEGSLFVVQRRSGNSLTHELIILNRHSTDNFQIPLTAEFQIQHQDPYLIFKQHASDNKRIIRGIWFHSAEERTAVHNVLERTLALIRQHEAALAAVSTPASDVGAATLATLFSPMNISTTTTPKNHNQETAAAAPTTPANAPPQHVASPSVAAPAVAATPTSASSPAASAAANASMPGVALDKKSLQLALLSLIQDDRFLDLLHSQYLRVVHARSAKNSKPP